MKNEPLNEVSDLLTETWIQLKCSDCGEKRINERVSA